MIEEFKYIFIRYFPLLVFMPLLLVVGNVVKPAAFLFSFLFFVIAGSKRQYHLTLGLTIILFLLGDSRQPVFSFCKDLRTLAVLYLFIMSLIEISSKQVDFKKIYLWILPFVFSTFISLTQSPVIGSALPRMFSYFFIFFVALHYIDYALTSDVKKFFRDTIGLIFIVEVVGFLGIFLFPSVVWYLKGDRYNGIFGNPNSLGIYTGINFIILYLYFFIYNKKISPLIKVMYLSALIAPVMLSGSRNGIITIFIFLFLIFFVKFNTFLKFISVSFITPTVVFLSNPDNLTGLLLKLGLAEKLRANTLKDGGGRFLAWEKAIENISISPLFGRGFFYQEHLFHLLYPILSKLGHEGDVHNSYLAFLLNVGFIGSILIFLFLFKLLNKFDDKKYIIPVVGAIGFNAFFEPWLTSSLSPFMIYFLILIIILMRHNFILEVYKKS